MPANAVIVKEAIFAIVTSLATVKICEPIGLSGVLR